MKTFKSPSGGKKLAMRVTVAALTSACAVAPAPQMEDELRSLSSALLPSVGAFPSLSAEDGLVGDGFGVVAIDTDTLAIGSPGADIDGLRDHGAVYIYQRDQTSGWKQIQKLISPTRQSGDQFGKSLAVRGDVLAVGAPTEDAPGISDQGVVHVFRRNQDGTNTWTLSGSLTNDVGSFGYFGTDLAIDDNVILIGAPGAHGQEGAVVLRDVSFDFANLGELRNSAGRSGEHFGHALALAGDTLAIGAPGGYEIHGSVFVFQRLPDVTNAWSEATRIIDGSGEANAQFGEGMALDGQTLLVSTQSVSVRIYERDRGAPNAWGLHTILSPDAADAYGFAYDGAVALRGDEAWVGSPSASGNGFTGQGIVYHYWHDRQNGDQWREAPHLTAPDGLPHDSFGAHVDVNATSLVVGATGAQGKGRAYILDTSVSLSNSATCVSLANCAVPTTALLTPGSSITTASGALLGAGEESLERPMPATIAATCAPDVALGEHLRPVGGYYLVGAPQLLLAPSNAPFLLGLPVPAGTSPEHLAAAALVSAGQSSSPEPLVWEPLQGRYDEDDHLFVIALGALLPEGTTVVLVEYGEINQLPAPAGPLQRSPEASQFVVQCNFAQPTFGACTDANKRHLADELSAQYHDLVEILQFTPPALSTATGRFMPGAVPGYDADSYLAYLATKDVGLCQLEAGSYRAIDKTLSVCVDPLIRDGSEDIRAVVRHELFHAIQHAYEPLRREALSNPDRARWLMEGTAWAAEQSGVTMKRSSVQPLRPVTVTLTSEIYERSAQSQDFWVYTGRTSALTFLSPILARGAFAESVAAELKLAEAYWQWSKNQAYEKTDPLGIEGKTPCAVDPDVVSVGLTVNHPDGPFGALTLTPLTSALIELKFIKEDAFKVIGIGASPAEEGAVIRMEDLRFKVYTEHGNCAEDLGEGGLQLNRRIAAGERFLILVANTSVTGSMKVALELSIIPN